VTRRIAFALLAMATAQAAVYLVRPTTSYRLLGLGHGATAVGLVAAAFALVPLFLAIPLGRRADRQHGGRLLVGGCATQIVGCLFLAAGRSPLALAAASAIVGIGHLGLALGSQAVVARESGDERHDQHFGLLTAGVSLGQLVGPLLAGFILGARSGSGLVSASTHAMLIAAGIAALATVLAVVSERGHDGSTTLHRSTSSASIGSILGTRGVGAGIFASVIVLSAADVFTAYMPVLGEQRGIGPTTVGVLLALRAGSSLFTRVGIGTLVARFGRVRLMTVTAAAAAVGMAALTFTQDIALLAVFVLLLGAGLGFGQPLSMTIVVQLVPESARATALAVRLTGNRVGQVAAPAAAALVAGSAGARSVFWLMSGALAVSAGILRRPARTATPPPEAVADS
jgi:MFS family permease